MPQKKIIVGITGASGALYAKRTLQAIAEAEVETYLIISPTGRRLLHDELGIPELNLEQLLESRELASRVTLLPYKDVGAVVASGSFKTDGMVVVPCSNNSLAQFAHGFSDNLIARAVAVTLKERRRLIIVHRETPLGLIELRNMTALAEAGAIICPANPGFYNLPQTIDDLVAMITGRILDLLDISHALHARWSGKSPLSDQPSLGG